MKYNENHPKEILLKVHHYEETHIAFLKRKLEDNIDFKVEYIYQQVLSGIHRKKNNVVTFHPGSDRFLENLYLRIRQIYYEIIDKYKDAHISRLNDELETIKAWLIKSYDKEKYLDWELARAIEFISKFSIYQATNFIVRDIVYEKMISNPIFTNTIKNSKGKFIQPKANGNNDLNGLDTESLPFDKRIKGLEERSADVGSDNDMMDAQGAADFTGYKLATVRIKTSKRMIPFHKLPNSSAVRYSKKELLEWMKKGNFVTRVSLLENLANGIRKKNI
ncbi:MAG: hypothetical protein K9H62_24200 [Bacteroidales bacterium]|nr:hypothetical protein [Bacteroidales bacterium]